MSKPSEREFLLECCECHEEFCVNAENPRHTCDGCELDVCISCWDTHPCNVKVASNG